MHLGSFAVAMIALATGCGDDDPAEPAADSTTTSTTSTTSTTVADSPVGLANPASTYCVEHGGTSEIRTAPDGSQSGICRLADGTEVDEWEYYRQQSGATTTTP